MLFSFSSVGVNLKRATKRRKAPKLGCTVLSTPPARNCLVMPITEWLSSIIDWMALQRAASNVSSTSLRVSKRLKWKLRSKTHVLRKRLFASSLS